MNSQYPIGRFQRPTTISNDQRLDAIHSIKKLPYDLEDLLSGIKPGDWDKCYREGGWNIRQLVHHLADSHMNAYIRFKLAATENNPTIKPYMEDQWAIGADYSFDLLPASRSIIPAVHSRWSVLLGNFSEEDWQKGYFHPEQNKLVLLDEAAMLYQWHGRHHLEHIHLALGN